MNNSRFAFNFLDKYDRDPVGYKEITCHLIFNVKMDLTRKARYLSGGYLAYPPLSITYASVFIRNSVY